jgi:hypothetical protein
MLAMIGTTSADTVIDYDIRATAGESLNLANISNSDALENGWGETDYSIYTPFYGHPASFDSSTTFDAIKPVGYKADGTEVTTGNNMSGITEVIGNFGMAHAAYFSDTHYGESTHGRRPPELEGWHHALGHERWHNDHHPRDTGPGPCGFIPEPSTLALLGMGGLGLLAYAWRRRRSGAIA